MEFLLIKMENNFSIDFIENEIEQSENLGDFNNFFVENNVKIKNENKKNKKNDEIKNKNEIKKNKKNDEIINEKKKIKKKKKKKKKKMKH